LKTITNISPYNLQTPEDNNKKFQKSDWDMYYAKICNIEPLKSNNQDFCLSMKKISQKHRVEIALKMYENKDELFTYRPTHIVYGKECMIIQSRAFCIINQKKNKSHIIEIPFQNCNQEMIPSPKEGETSYTIVREIAFGPVNDPSVRSVALWFDIPSSVIIPWSDRLNLENSLKYMHYSQDCISSFDAVQNKPFYIFYNTNTDCHKFNIEILKHHWKKLFHRETHHKDNSFCTFHKAEMFALKAMFQNAMVYWSAWHYPRKQEKDNIDPNALVPPVDQEYNFQLPQENTSFASCTAWNSFVNTMRFNSPEKNPKENKRLQIFNDFSDEKICVANEIPHLTSKISKQDILKQYNKYDQGKTCLKNDSTMFEKGERCWRVLLTHECYEEWEKVREIVFEKTHVKLKQVRRKNKNPQCF